MANSFKGIVTSIKYAPNPSDDKCAIISSKVFYCKRDGNNIDVGDVVESKNFEKFPISKVGRCSNEAYEALLSKRLAQIYTSRNTAAIKKHYKKHALKTVLKMARQLDLAARVLLKALISNAPISVHFHNDGDGASGAIALYRAISSIEAKSGISASIAWRMSRSISYSMEDFYYDDIFFQGSKSMEKPLVFIIDFGTNRESEEGLSQAAKSCNVVMIDHHMPYNGFDAIKPKNYINPWDFGSDSNFTAGALAAVFAELISGLDLEIFEKSSFISDFSSFGDFTTGSKAEKMAVVMDYLTSVKKSSGKIVTPSYMDPIITNEEKLESTYARAKNLMAEAIDAGIRVVKDYKAGSIIIHVVDFKRIAPADSDYPLPGRYSSALQQKFEVLDNGSTITIVHYGNFISIRISKLLSDSVDILGKISSLVTETNGMASGGGHKEAASIKVGEANIDRMLRRVLELLGVKFK
ncbi:MAG: DHH family phosphoesterase [Candidatus Micrarchaeaceae archaeon]